MTGIEICRILHEMKHKAVKELAQENSKDVKINRLDMTDDILHSVSAMIGKKNLETAVTYFLELYVEETLK